MIARNRAIDFHRVPRATEEITDDLQSTPGDQSRATEILEVIRGLPDAYRETLVLRLVEGMTGPEIALRTGLTNDSVRVNLHRGMKLLRAKLGLQEVL
jgi:RNA polymerase sigma-70 factor (ECF subfamily)